MESIYRRRVGRSMLLESFVCVMALWATGAASAGTVDPEIQLVSEQPGWERAWTHEALEPLYNVSLYPDIAVFRSRVRLASALGIANQLKRYHMNNTRVKRGTAVVVVRSGKLYGLTFDDFSPAYRIRLDTVVNELQRHQDAGHVKLEDTIFILNTRDVPLCLLGYCLVPLFSPIKEFRNNRPYSDDLLVPLMAYPQEQLVNYPPETKIRGGVMPSYKGEVTGADGSSCRSFVRRFAREQPAREYLTVLEPEELLSGAAGGGEGAGGGAGGDAESQMVVSGITPPPPPPEKLAPWWAVLSCDCQTANPGLASLLATNSLVLRGRSVWNEYYYRALEDGVHYREFDPGYAFEAVKDSLKASQRTKVAATIEAAQRFVYEYLSQRSRALYYEKAISLYNTLFGPGYMQAVVSELPPDRPPSMDDILQLKMYPKAWRQGLA